VCEELPHREGVIGHGGILSAGQGKGAVKGIPAMRKGMLFLEGKFALRLFGSA